MIGELSTHNYYITPSPLHKVNTYRILGERAAYRILVTVEDKNNVEQDSEVTTDQLQLQRWVCTLNNSFSPF